MSWLGTKGCAISETKYEQEQKDEHE